ncbi:HET domain-containing protein [Neurospora intermedia]|uniref:HET domain-containing protein n=1 Tax=Neurospora intermedia TaxID=5142 RepID=A0ABR3D5T2_NEUIN
MRLMNTETLELHEFFESQAPSYAILSHTWDKEEITFQEMLSKSPSTMVKAGYKKIQDTCKMAQSRGQQWVWVDTCCIDKSSSAELTESINSMYRWYQNAHECYAYLVDLAPGSLPQDELEKCRWFTRGFTLQELIAPKTVVFFDRDWNVIGGKKDEGILEIIVRTTGISELVLAGSQPVGNSTIAERMLWASSRETTRPEDKAYCLLGIFEINMPLIYGEGDNAFRRLQEEIIKRSKDLSIFAWGTPLYLEPTKKESLTERRYLGLFAKSPADFGAAWEHIGMPPSRYGIPQAFVLDEDDLPEIGSLIQQNHIPHHVLFPGHGKQSSHLLNKGPGYGRQKVIMLGTAKKPQRVTIGIETNQTDPPAVFDCALGRIRPWDQLTVKLHATIEDDVNEVHVSSTYRPMGLRNLKKISGVPWSGH